TIFLYFCQAEDGIRVFHVTGVQTCALPIYSVSIFNSPSPIAFRILAFYFFNNYTKQFIFMKKFSNYFLMMFVMLAVGFMTSCGRSEERRVGKEGRSGGGSA